MPESSGLKLRRLVRRFKHADWCPRKGEPPNMSGGYCSTCGEKVKP